MWNTLYMYTQRRPGKLQTPMHWNPIARSMTELPPVITQQYSSAMFVLMCCRSRMEKFGQRFYFFYFFFFIFKNYLVRNFVSRRVSVHDFTKRRFIIGPETGKYEDQFPVSWYTRRQNRKERNYRSFYNYCMHVEGIVASLWSGWSGVSSPGRGTAVSGVYPLSLFNN